MTTRARPRVLRLGCNRPDRFPGSAAPVFVTSHDSPRRSAGRPLGPPRRPPDRRAAREATCAPASLPVLARRGGSSRALLRARDELHLLAAIRALMTNHHLAVTLAGPTVDPELVVKIALQSLRPRRAIRQGLATDRLPAGSGPRGRRGQPTPMHSARPGRVRVAQLAIACKLLPAPTPHWPTSRPSPRYKPPGHQSPLASRSRTSLSRRPSCVRNSCCIASMADEPTSAAWLNAPRLTAHCANAARSSERRSRAGARPIVRLLRP